MISRLPGAMCLLTYLFSPSATASDDSLIRSGHPREAPAALTGEPALESVAQLAWHSRYLSEGREAFGEDGMLSFATSFGYNVWSLEIWQSWADDSAAREFQAFAGYTYELGPLELTLGLAYIDDFSGGDDEIDAALGFTTEVPFGFELEAAFYHGFERDGSYLETGILRSWAFPYFELSASAHLGSNFGYIVEGHDGIDHLSLHLHLSREIVENITLGIGYSYQFSINADAAKHPEDADLYDGSVVGVSLDYSF